MRGDNNAHAGNFLTRGPKELKKKPWDAILIRNTRKKRKKRYMGTKSRFLYGETGQKGPEDGGQKNPTSKIGHTTRRQIQKKSKRRTKGSNAAVCDLKSNPQGGSACRATGQVCRSGPESRRGAREKKKGGTEGEGGPSAKTKRPEKGKTLPRNRIGDSSNGRAKARQRKRDMQRKKGSRHCPEGGRSLARTCCNPVRAGGDPKKNQSQSSGKKRIADFVPVVAKTLREVQGKKKSGWPDRLGKRQLSGWSHRGKNRERRTFKRGGPITHCKNEP